MDITDLLDWTASRLRSQLNITGSNYIILPQTKNKPINEIF